MPLLTTEERVGTVLAGKYRLDRILGEGGMGVVYAGHHLRLDRRIAVKFLHPGYAQDAGVVSRFFSEAQAAARLEHPNVVDIYDLDQAEDGSYYMVLEFLEGESLSDRLARRGSLPAREVVSLIAPVLDALERAHESGIIHRDLKPDNIFLMRRRDGEIVPKVLDFGIAKLADAQRGGTATGTVMGTPAYMAPEQAMGNRNIGPWTDVWSMGIVIYECLTGRYPFDLEPDMTPTGIVVTILSNEPHPLVRFRPEAAASLRECVDRALQKDPAQRWQRMSEVRSALEDAPLPMADTVKQDPPAVRREQDSAPQAQPDASTPNAAQLTMPPTVPFSDRRPLLAAALACVLGVAVMVGWFLTSDSDAPPPEGLASQTTHTDTTPATAAVPRPVPQPAPAVPAPPSQPAPPEGAPEPVVSRADVDGSPAPAQPVRGRRAGPAAGHEQSPSRESMQADGNRAAPPAADPVADGSADMAAVQPARTRTSVGGVSLGEF